MFVLGLGAAVVTLLGVDAATTLMTGSAVAGLWAAASWTLVSADQALQANQPNIEVFMNVCLVWLFVLVAARRTHPVLIGVVGALASLYKLVTIPALLLLFAVYVAMPPVGSSRRAALRAGALAVVTASGVWAAIVG